MILTEKYMEDINQSNKGGFSLIQYFVWEIIISCVLVILLGWLPLHISFPSQISHTINGVIIIFLCIDFLKSYLKSILKESTKEGKLLDVVYLVSFIIIQYSQIRYLQSIALLISVISSFKKLQQKYKIWSIYLECELHFLFVICKILLLVHYCACLFRMIGILNQESWITELGLTQHDTYTIYCYSLYWSVASLLNIGQSTIKISTEIELIYSTIVMLISGFVFSYILYHSINFIKAQDDCFIRKQLRTINHYFKDKNVSLKLKGQIRNFIQKENTDLDDQNEIKTIVSKLPPQIKEKLYLQTRLASLYKCQLLKKFSKNILKRLTQFMQELYYGQNQIIEQSDQSLYLIYKGKVQVIEYNKIVGYLNEGENFGQYQFFTGNQIKTIYRASEPTSLYKFSQQEFLKIIKNESLDYERFMYIKQSLLNGNYSIIDQRCSFCESSQHLIRDCSRINYKPNIEKLIITQTFGTQFRQKNIRRDTYRNRVNNQVLTRLKITREALKVFREHNNLVSDGDSADDDDQSFQEYTHQDPPSDQFFTSNSNNRIIEPSKEGTTVSLLRPQQEYIQQQTLDLQENQEEVVNNKKQLACQRHFELAQLIDEQYLPQMQYRVSLWPIDQLNKKSYSQLDQLSQQELASEGPTPAAKLDEKKRHKTSRFPPKTHQILNNKSSIPPNTRIKPEDYETLNLSNRLSEEQLTNPFTKHGRQQSNPYTNQSMKRIFSSKLSIIPTKNQLAIFEKQNQNPQAALNLQFQNSPQFMDLETCRNNLFEQEFENMREFNIFYPLQNYSNIVRNANNQIRLQLKLMNQSNYSFKTRIRHITQQLQTYNKMKI